MSLAVFSLLFGCLVLWFVVGCVLPAAVRDAHSSFLCVWILDLRVDLERPLEHVTCCELRLLRGLSLYHGHFSFLFLLVPKWLLTDCTIAYISIA